MTISVWIRRSVRTTGWLALLGLMVGLTPVRAAQAQTAGPQTYVSDLSHAQVSYPSATQVVITMQAVGALPGLLTLTLNHDAGSTAVTSATWALAVAYAQYSPLPAGTTSDDPDAQAMTLVNEGTLGGKLTGATLVVDSNGAVVGVSGAQLFIVSGSLQFDGAAGGGSMQATGFADFATSSGTLSLNF